MVILSEQVPDDDSFCKPSLPLGSSGELHINPQCTRLDTHICSLSSYSERLSYIPNSYFLCKEQDLEQALPISYNSYSLGVEGQWICSTDLLQDSSYKRRPRLLPHSIKMYTFIPHDTNGLHETSVPALPGDPFHSPQKKNIKRHFMLRYLHPKKRALQAYLWKHKSSNSFTF
ncbi:uncharacterized protein LOC108701852 [Xenopus laevis]|uniref:Uncharacterized protein LOC108701852 n=2 Tax=Xenopus laevis TaxID=8355 RepID=A0A1L8EWJ2_XENLA|nr:uncharacterized protein LOC108701852 [Xenopus laevis]OCT63693.1 hypothetical protein XELAEV_18044793mg [Xenopus laevis]